MALKNVTLSKVIELFEAGYTRLEKDNTDGIGSIEKYFSLTPQEKTQLFNHPKIKGYRRKVVAPVTMEIVDDLDSMNIEDDLTSAPNTENSGGFTPIETLPLEAPQPITEQEVFA